MTKRELKKLAQKMINSLSKQIKSPEDIWYLDELILEELEP